MAVLAHILRCALLCLFLVSFGTTAAARVPDIVEEWQSLPSIKDAVALEALDGPDDIQEKIEIIEDRVDKLAQSAHKITTYLQTIKQRINAYKNQKEVLRDIATIRQGVDSRISRQLSELFDKEEAASQDLQKAIGSRLRLHKEIHRLTSMILLYKNKAKDLGAKEHLLP